jgi:ABC-type bacteriocin/lantibiotic exporter with double-glycine peptidase domain
MRFYSNFLRLNFIFLFGLGLGCASMTASPGSGLERLSKQAQRLQIPFHRQAASNLCGLASLDMLTGYYKLPLKAGEADGLKEEADTTDGISGKSLQLALEEAGYGVRIFPGTLDRQITGLYRQIDMERPCILMTGAAPRHYWVLSGYDEHTSMLVFMDPASGLVAMDVSDFVKIWKQANFFTLLATPLKP